MQVIVDAGVPSARLFIPHYWAVYIHDGRGPIPPDGNRLLVYFANPKDDPRIQGGYPERVSQIRKLSRTEFHAGLAENAEHKRLGLSPFMFVLKSVGPAAGTPFFTSGMVGLVGEVTPQVAAQFDTFIQGIVDEIGPETDDASFTI